MVWSELDLPGYGRNNAARSLGWLKKNSVGTRTFRWSAQMPQQNEALARHSKSSFSKTTANGSQMRILGDAWKA